MLNMKPFTSFLEIYSNHLESPGTKAYSVSEATKMFSPFEHTSIKTVLCHGDLLTSGAGQRHRGIVLTLTKIIWPRWFFKAFMKSHEITWFIYAN
jgi:hypothetical protein